MLRGFAENASTHTRRRRAAQVARLSFDVDCLLGRSEIMLRGIKKDAENVFMYTHSCRAAKATPSGRTLTMDIMENSACNDIIIVVFQRS
jgi:hypothetical protein